MRWYFEHGRIFSGKGGAVGLIGKDDFAQSTERLEQGVGQVRRQEAAGIHEGQRNDEPYVNRRPKAKRIGEATQRMNALNQKPRTALVIPSVRPECLEAFCRAWAPVADWDMTILVWDGEKSPAVHGLSGLAAETFTYDWRMIDAELGDDAWIVSRKNAGIRTYGFLKAVEHGADVIATIDDDCYPVPGEPLMANHLRNLYYTPRWVEQRAEHDGPRRAVPADRRPR